tara:strand:- start:842 stop:1714 length:873 start_codon:yes stop_codon:yes gene_type:complete
MRISVYPKFGPINSKKVFEAFIESLEKAGDEIQLNCDGNNDVTVIWSVLWQGRMLGYKKIWDECQLKNKPIVVLEVGGIKRNETFKVGINGVNREADFANQDVDGERWKKFNIELKPWQSTGDTIIICGQHHRSHQWRNNPTMNLWFEQQINEIRKHTNRPILVRPHPRNPVGLDTSKWKNVSCKPPQRDYNTIDDTDFKETLKHAWAVINYSSNPAMMAVFNGIPVFVSAQSLCYDVGNTNLSNINKPSMPDRNNWANKLAYTEWTTEEIKQGLPWRRIKKRLEEKYLK